MDTLTVLTVTSKIYVAIHVQAVKGKQEAHDLNVLVSTETDIAIYF